MQNIELDYLTQEESELVTGFRSLSDEGKEYILFQLKIAAKGE